MRRGAIPAAARRLGGDARGVAAVEFALIAPAFLLILLGLMDISYNIYTNTLLEGAIQEAGRDSTIEGAEARGLAIDEEVRDVVDDIVPHATIEFDRRAYVDYSDIDRPEDFTDTNEDGVCNDGEPFEDVNGNGSWDQDRGRAEMGGARDAVLYTVTVSYPRAFPLASLIGLDPNITTRARTVLRNQPYGPQNRAAPVGNCE